MSFMIPKKPQILYSPMLATFGGGSARGFNPGVTGGEDIVTDQLYWLQQFERGRWNKRA